MEAGMEHLLFCGWHPAEDDDDILRVYTVEGMYGKWKKEYPLILSGIIKKEDYTKVICTVNELIASVSKELKYSNKVIFSCLFGGLPLLVPFIVGMVLACKRDNKRVKLVRDYVASINPIDGINIKWSFDLVARGKSYIYALNIQLPSSGISRISYLHNAYTIQPTESINEYLLQRQCYNIILSGLVEKDEFIIILRGVQEVIDNVNRQRIGRTAIASCCFYSGIMIWIPFVPAIIMESMRQRKITKKVQVYLDSINPQFEAHGFKWIIKKTIGIEFLPHFQPENRVFCPDLYPV